MKTAIISATLFFLLPIFLYGQEKSYDYMTQNIFAEEIFAKAMDEIEKNYPVETLRKEMVNIFNDNRAGKLNFTMSRLRAKDVPSIIGCDVNSDGVEMITFFMSTIMEMHENNGQDYELLKDILVEGMLHEYYHIKHHGATKKTGDALIKQESEAWWNTCDHVLPEMETYGRTKILKKYNIAVEAHKLAKGDIQSPIWVALIKKIYAPLYNQK